MLQTAAAIDVAQLAWRCGAFSSGSRLIPEEVPVALTYDGAAHAVMMASPGDLADFAIGFSISEDVIGSPSDLKSLDIVEVDGGFEARMWLNPERSEHHRRRRRSVLGPAGCGLCGVESIAEALKPPPLVESGFAVTANELSLAMTRLQSLQKLYGQTRAVHAAGLYRREAAMIVREDVGRHNALDKLIGAAAQSLPAANSVVLLTSRVSVELVQKTARFGAPVIAAISAPTALAVRTAEQAGITLAAILRGDSFEIFSHSKRIA
jgi:FdhD protein